MLKRVNFVRHRDQKSTRKSARKRNRANSMDFRLRTRGVIDRPVSMPLVGKHALVFHRWQTVGILVIIISLHLIRTWWHMYTSQRYVFDYTWLYHTWCNISVVQEQIMPKMPRESRFPLIRSIWLGDTTSLIRTWSRIDLRLFFPLAFWLMLEVCLCVERLVIRMSGDRETGDFFGVLVEVYTIVLWNYFFHYRINLYLVSLGVLLGFGILNLI